MPNGQTMTLWGNRDRAHALVDRAPPGAILNIREPARSPDQNAKMWAMLSDVARAKPQGRTLPTEIWKALFMASCGHQVRFEPALDGQGVVATGFSSSRLSKAEFGDLIEAIYSYGAEHGVQWSEPHQEADRRAA